MSAAVLTSLLLTLLWTGVLIALVLLVRRPVNRWFGPEAAYALWALPALRLVLPPMVLPEWLALPGTAAPVTVAVASAQGPALGIGPVAAEIVTTAIPAEPALAGAAQLAALVVESLALPALAALWLAGAGVILWRRFAAYFALRSALLAEAREVGRVRGHLRPVRLIETPATTAPLALGVLDPIIALPPGFLALPDRQARDLALAHELSHHRGGDLIINVAVQPLFALHWFTPLARYGWLALRRDQEAACDARVIARRTPHERAAYAALIARFAAAPEAHANSALTAAMACPVLGEKSVIHRLRSLAMTDLSPRRRLAGRALLTAGVLALPLTATMGRAAQDAVEEAAQPVSPPVAPAVPEAPEAPEAPVPPRARTVFITIDPDSNIAVTRDEGSVSDADEAGDAARSAREARIAEREVFRVFLREGKRSGEAERKAMGKSIAEGLAQADRVMADLPGILAESLASAETAPLASVPRIIVKRDCEGGEAPRQTTQDADGRSVITLCPPRMAFSMRRDMAQAREDIAKARKDIAKARDEIARSRDLSEETKARVLRELDGRIMLYGLTEG